jgi:hypothetical protein
VIYSAESVFTASMSIPGVTNGASDGTEKLSEADLEFSWAEGKDTKRRGAFFTRGSQL